VGECFTPGVAVPVFAATGGVVGAAPTEPDAGSAALRSPLRTRSAAGGNADLPADKARRRAIDAARPPTSRVASGGIAIFAGAGAGACGAAGTGAPTKLKEPLGGEVDVATEALRSPLRTRSAAGGRADLPAESARRRSIEAARPEIALKAGMLRSGGLNQREPARYTMKAVP
jgi:hypothetical protein